jgi:hypothetical protein
MITINGLNKWTPAIYKSECPVDWTAERNKAYAKGSGCKQSYGNDTNVKNAKR